MMGTEEVHDNGVEDEQEAMETRCSRTVSMAVVAGGDMNTAEIPADTDQPSSGRRSRSGGGAGDDRSDRERTRQRRRADRPP